MFSTSGVAQYIGGIPWVTRGDTMSTSGDTMSTSGDTMSTSGDVQYIGGISWCMWGDTMSTSGDVQYIRGISWYMWGSNLIKSFQFLLKTPMYWTFPDVLMISPRCTHDILPMYSWYPPNVLMVSPRCTHGISPMYWTPHDVLMISPRCTHGIPPMYWMPPMYWTHIIQGDTSMSVVKLDSHSHLSIVDTKYMVRALIKKKHEDFGTHLLWKPIWFTSSPVVPQYKSSGYSCVKKKLWRFEICC